MQARVSIGYHVIVLASSLAADPSGVLASATCFTKLMTKRHTFNMLLSALFAPTSTIAQTLV